MHVHIYIYMFFCFVCVNVSMHAIDAYRDVFIYECMYLCMHAHWRVCTYVCIYAHTGTHTHFSQAASHCHLVVIHPKQALSFSKHTKLKDSPQKESLHKGAEWSCASRNRDTQPQPQPQDNHRHIRRQILYRNNKQSTPNKKSLHKGARWGWTRRTHIGWHTHWLAYRRV